MLRCMHIACLVFAHSSSCKMLDMRLGIYSVLPYSMEQSPSWKTNRFAASQEISRILWSPFITAFTSNRHLSLSWDSSIQSIPPTSHFLKIHLHIILPSTSGSPQWSLSLRFPHQNPVHASPSPIRTTCPAHRILLDFITRTILGEEYRSLSSSLCSFLHSPVTSSHVGPTLEL